MEYAEPRGQYVKDESIVFKTMFSQDIWLYLLELVLTRSKYTEHLPGFEEIVFLKNLKGALF